MPFPAVYELRGHEAKLLWDGASDDSLYQGYPQGQIEFALIRGQVRMTVTGRADPGWLVFSKSGRRGFDARTEYGWKGEAFVPISTEYSANQDFRLYQFISALHLHDFRAAYAVIDPGAFLASEKPSLEAFREKMKQSYPEFLDDRIFEAQEPAGDGPGDFSFELTLSSGRFVYHPRFSADARHLLIGLERRKE